MLVGVVAAVLAVAALVGIGSARFNTPRASALQPAPPSPAVLVSAPVHAPTKAEWRRIVGQIDAARSRAFRQADSRLLSDVYWRGHVSASDKFGLDLLHDQRLRAAGFRQTVLQVKPLWETPQRAQLRVVDRIAAYRIVDRDGRVLAAKPGRRQRYLLTVGYHASHWWVQAVAAA